jgi:hypothetical protein
MTKRTQFCAKNAKIERQSAKKRQQFALLALKSCQKSRFDGY